MTWFKVDDSLHSHPKTMAVSLAAVGLWAVAGSWSSDHLTDGFIPDHMVALLSRGQAELPKELCAAGLWKRARGGFRFHQWHEDGDGSARNPSKEEVVSVRQKRAEAGRKGGLASGKIRSKPASKREANASAGASRIVQPPSRPVPSRRDGGSLGADVEGDQSVRVHARANEALRFIRTTYGLTDDESSTVWSEAEQRAPEPIKNPVKYLEAMAAKGDLADIVKAVMDASAPGEPSFDPPPAPVTPVERPAWQAPAPTTPDGPTMTREEAIDFAHIKTCLDVGCARCHQIQAEHPHLHRRTNQ